MKKILIIICGMMGVFALAQNREIEFKSADWNTHLATAKSENKLIFFDAYTTWCAPCKVMAKDVFTKDEVADLFNDKFINAKYDMEKGEGLILKETYGVSAYPTYLFINGDGDLVHKIVGSMPVQEFMKEANNALNPENTLYGLAKNFEALHHSEASAIAYLDALDKAYESEKMSVVSKLYFDGLPKRDLLEVHYWNLALKYLNNPSSQAFSYLYENRLKLVDKFGATVVNNYFQRVFGGLVYMIKNAYKTTTGVKYAKENSEAIRGLLREKNSYSDALLDKLDLIEFASLNKWDRFSAKLDSICAESELSKKTYIVIEAANDAVTRDQVQQYENVLKWANLIENTKPGLFTQIQLAELRKRVLNRQGKTDAAKVMSQIEEELRKEAAEKRLMTPPMIKD